MWLDDLIGLFSPMAAFRRKQARMATKMLGRAYDGAKTGRRTDGWITPSTSANAEISAAGSRLRDRARDLSRNNPFGRKAKRVFADNFIGEGISPQASTGVERLDKQIMKAWKEWSQVCDADGNCDFSGLQALIVKSVFESGECFVRLRDRFSTDGMAVPFQLQVLESDYLDTTRNTEVAGGYVRQGIEFDSLGRRIAYWMWSQHPGESTILSPRLQSVRVPADQILHIYEKDRPGQIRGVSSYAPVILRMRDLDDYDDAEMWRKKIESCFAAFVIQNNGKDGPSLSTIAQQGGQGTGTGGTSDKRVETFRPGMIEYLRSGEDVKFGSPTSDANYAAYMRVQLHAIAAGLGITYEQLTGDLSQVNYSSLRAGLLEFRRMIETLRWQMFIPMFCLPVWRRFIDRAYLAGLISRVDYSVNWTAPKFEMIDPLKDAQADLLLIRSGLLTYREAVSRHGYDPDKQLTDIAQINQALDELKIILDCDPRNTAKSGTAQIFNPDEGDDDAASAKSAKKRKLH